MMEKSSSGCMFCIIDCPSQHYFKQLQNNTELALHEESGGRLVPWIMIHLSSTEVVQTQEYQNWMERFAQMYCKMLEEYEQ